MAIYALRIGTLGDFNVALVAAAGLVVPLSAQLDALLAAGLGPFQAELQAQFNAALAAQATLALEITDPLAALKAALAALAQLQAALSAALTLPPINLSLSAELGATAALIGALSARLGLLRVAIEAALRIKLGALQAVAGIQANLSVGPIIAIAITGESWAANASKLASLLNGGTVDGYSIPGHNPAETAAGGVLLLTGDASAANALGAIIDI